MTTLLGEIHRSADAANPYDRDGLLPSPEEWKDPVVQTLLASLGGREYAVLHGWKSLHEGPTSDVDIVIARDDLPALELALRRECGARIAQVIRYEGGCGFFFVAIREDGDGPKFTQIDAATGYSRDGRILLDSSELLKARWNHGGMWVVSPEAEFSYLLTKKICKRQFPVHQRMRLAELTQRLGIEAIRIAEDIVGGAWASNLVDDIASSNWSGIEMRLDSLHRRLLISASQRHRWNVVRYWAAELPRALWRWRNPTGLMLAVLGPDGSGKSTLIENLKSKARPLFWWEAALFHFRPDVWGTTVDRGPVVEPHSERPRSPLSSVLKLSYYACDFVVGYLTSIRPGLVRSRLMIFDRYYHDILVDQRRYRYGAPMLFARMISRFVPGPDMFVVVDAPEEIIEKRKQELSHDELRRQRLGYRNLAASLPNAVLLDGSASPSEVAREAHKHLINRMVVRYERRRKTWFNDENSGTLRWASLALSQGDSDYIAMTKASAGPRRCFHWFQLADGRGYLLAADSKSAAVEGLSLYRPQRVRSVIAKHALRIALQVGIAPRVLPQVYVQERNSPGLPHGVFEYLDRVFRKPLSYAVSLGTPGPHRKPVIELIGEGDHPVGYAKIGWNAVTNALVRNEAETYMRLSAAKFRSFALPTLVHSASWGSHVVTIESGPECTTNAPSSVNPYVTAVKELAKDTAVRVRMRESAFGKDLCQRMEASADEPHGWLVREAVQTAFAVIGDRAIPFHLAHGDLTPWNACMAGNTLYLFDWEYSQPDAPAGWDLCHFFLQTNSLIARRSPTEIVGRFKAFVPLIQDYLREVDVCQDLLPSLLLLYLARRLLCLKSNSTQALEIRHLLSSLASLFALECQEQIRAVRRSHSSMEQRGQ